METVTKPGFREHGEEEAKGNTLYHILHSAETQPFSNEICVLRTQNHYNNWWDT